MKKRHHLPRRALAALLGAWLAAASVPAMAAASAEAPLPQRFLATTEPAVILTFGGLTQEAPLRHILDCMAENGLRGTFFVTERELARNAANIALIRAYGQDLAIGLVPVKGGTAEDYCAQIERIRTALRERYGTETAFARVMSGGNDADAMRAMRQAAASMGCTLAGQGLNVVQSKHKSAQSPAEVMPDIFGKWTTSLNRGEIVYLRTDFYENENLAAAMLLEIKRQKIDNIAYRTDGDAPEHTPGNDSAYHTASLQDIAGNAAARYAYPVDAARLPAAMQPDYGTDQVTDENFRSLFFARYIGAPEVSAQDRMLGFSRSEMARADKTGIVKTVADNTVFLTFDDWGNDDSINKILYVLKKHQVNGTFFIITRNMPNNPNLLRAIAAAGNEIGSHTNNHRPMAMQDEKGRQIAAETEEEYIEDVRSSYPKLLAAVGDMQLPSGRPALTRLLRPPTLAVSRSGVRAILNAGFTYIVNGYGSTEDYGAVSLQSLVGILNHIVHEEDGTVRRGAIAIMHMSATARLTAEALDILLSANDNLPEGHPGKFRVGLLGDYLTDGYRQDQRQVSAAK